jgi:hypothetical protein
MDSAVLQHLEDGLLRGDGEDLSGRDDLDLERPGDDALADLLRCEALHVQRSGGPVRAHRLDRGEQRLRAAAIDLGVRLRPAQQRGQIQQAVRVLRAHRHAVAMGRHQLIDELA